MSRTVRLCRAPAACAVLTALLLTGSAQADPVVWSFDVQTTGQDVFATASEPVDITADEFDTTYDILLLEVWVSWIGITFGPFDVTDEIPPEYRSASGTLFGPPPIVIIDQRLVFPLPPEPSAIEADMLIEIDVNGFGQLAITNIYLGELEINLGSPWGTQTVQLERIHVIGEVVTTAIYPGDLNRDGRVDLADLGVLLADFGCTAGPGACPGDVDGDGDTDLADLGILLANFGRGT